MHKLFDAAKVGCYLEAISHSTERRKDGEQKVIQLSLRVDPFDTKLATALAQEVRTTLFKLGNAEPHAHLRRVDFSLGTPRQMLTIYATPDTVKASIAIDHAKVTGIYARTSKDARGYVLVFKATFGPPGAKELEYCEHWRNSMAFVTFTEAEASDLFDTEADDDDDDEEDDKQQRLVPEPEFDTDGSGRPLETAGQPEAARQRIHSHAKGRKHMARASKPAAGKKGRR